MAIELAAGVEDSVGVEDAPDETANE